MHITHAYAINRSSPRFESSPLVSRAAELLCIPCKRIQRRQHCLTRIQHIHGVLCVLKRMPPPMLCRCLLTCCVPGLHGQPPTACVQAGTAAAALPAASVQGAPGTAASTAVDGAASAGQQGNSSTGVWWFIEQTRSGSSMIATDCC